MPIVPGGEFAKNLSKSREAALLLYEKLSNDSRFRTIIEPELDIVVWAPDAQSASRISRLSTEIFKIAASNNLHLAIFNYPAKLLKDSWQEVTMDVDPVTCLRSCLMKPEHLDWIDRIWKILSKVTDKVVAK